MRKLLLALLIIFALTAQVQAAAYYISTSGDDTANGTSTATPFATIGKATKMGITVVANGDLSAWASASDATSWSESLSGSSTISKDEADGYGDTVCANLNVVSGATVQIIQGTIAVVAGQTYTLSFAYKISDHSQNLAWSLADASDSWQYNATTPAWQASGVANIINPDTSEWVLYSIDIPVRSTATTLTLTLRESGTNTHTLKLDAASLGIKGTALTSDDFVYLKKGDTFREKLTAQTSGTSGHPITFSAYGTGANPIITGAIVKANADFSLSAEQTNTYQAAWTKNAALEAAVWENGTRLIGKASIAEVEAAAGSYYWNANVLYVHASDSSNVATNGIVYEIPSQTECIDDNGKDYLIFEYMECVRGFAGVSGLGGIKVTGSNNTFRYLSSHDHDRHSFSFYTGANDNLTHDCDFYDTRTASVISMYGAGTQDNILRGCNIYGLNLADSSISELIVIHGAATGNTLSNNHIYDSGRTATKARHIRIYDGGTDANIIERNLFDGIGSIVIDVYDNGGDFPENTIIRKNILNLASFSSTAIHLDQTTGTKILNNTAKGTAAQFFLLQEVNSTGTIVQNNIVNTGKYISVEAGSGVGGTYNYNAYNGGSATPFNWSGTDYNFADWKTNSSQDANSIASDPLMVNPSSGDFSLKPNSPAINAGASPFVNGDGDQYDFAGRLVWSDATDAAVGLWADGVDIGAIGRRSKYGAVLGGF